MIYLASPYTSPDPNIELQRVKAVALIAAHLVAKELPVMSPILHCHLIRQQCSVPGHYEFWQKWNHRMIQYSEVFLVATIDGWDRSTGLKGEMEFAKSINKRINYINPQTLQVTDEP